jgi:hypothetical protein
MNKKINFELLSIGFAIVFAALFMIPIYMKTGSNFLFYFSNSISIIVFLTFTRWIFLLKYSPFSRSKWPRLILVFLPIPLFMYHIDGLFEFQKFVDEEGTIAFFKGSNDMRDYDFGRFIKYEYIFFCVGALVTIVLMPIRMVISFWRTINTKDKV